MLLPVLILAPVPLVAMTAQEPEPAQEEELPLDVEQVRTAGEVIGIELTDAELELMLPGVVNQMRGYAEMQETSLGNEVPMALLFDPLAPRRRTPVWIDYPLPPLPEPDVERPEDLEDLAFADIPTLAALIRAREVSCVELAEMYLARLERLDGTLECTITPTRERALEQAQALDAELAEGKWRGPLHGIPWGAKDLLAVKGYRTTWGAKPYEEQTIDVDAAVVERLDAAGAVLVAKLTLGALAWGDVWFGGTTKNPWNPEQGSSGSSAGPSSATAAGCVAFAIGSETWGSIVSPSERCGNSALRPTFGAVSRHGAMTLCWSLDKLGPICRSVRDAEIVFAAIQGPDVRDAATLLGSGWRGAGDLEGLRVGYLKESFEESGERGRHAEFLAEMKALGVELVPVELPEYPATSMMMTILNAEAAAAFDELTRSGRDDELVRQERMAWPNVFRQARLVPAVEYIRANRLRDRLIREMEAVFDDVDLYVHPTWGGDSQTITNLTGHPTVIAPAGFGERRGTPYGVCFTGRLFGDAQILAVARAWQESTGYHEKHPGL